MIALIRDGVEQGGVWADLGAGTGAFTRVLGELLGPRGLIYAVDRDARALQAQRFMVADGAGSARVQVIHADFTQPLALPPLNGALKANALHFVKEQETMLARVSCSLRPGGSLLLVEYDVAEAHSWLPYPVPRARFSELANVAGLGTPKVIGKRRSPSSGIEMYAAVLVRGLREAVA